MERLWTTVMSRLDRDNAEWGISRRVATLAVLAPFALALLAVVLIPYREAFRILANEDGIAELLRWVSLVVLAVIYLGLAVALWRHGQRLPAALYMAATLAVIFTAGEEIAWGQRIVHWIAPGTYDDISYQGETNLQTVASFLKVSNLVVMAAAFVGAVLPLVRWSVWRDRVRSIAGYALIPPAALIPAFTLEFTYRAIRLLFLPTPRNTLTKFSEITELSFHIALVVFGLLAWRVIIGGWRPIARGDGPAPPAAADSLGEQASVPAGHPAA